MSSEYYPYGDSDSRNDSRTSSRRSRSSGSSEHTSHGSTPNSGSSYSAYSNQYFEPSEYSFSSRSISLKRPASSPHRKSPIRNVTDQDGCHRLYPGVPCPPKKRKCCEHAENNIHQSRSRCTCRKRPKTTSKSMYRNEHQCKGPCKADPTCEHCVQYEFAPAQCTAIRPQPKNEVSYERYYFYGVPELHKDKTVTSHTNRFDQLVPCHRGLKIRQTASVNDKEDSKSLHSTQISVSSLTTDRDPHPGVSSRATRDNDRSPTRSRSYPHPSKTTRATGSSLIYGTSSFAGNTSNRTLHSWQPKENKSLMVVVPKKNQHVENIPLQRNFGTLPRVFATKVASTTYSGPIISDRGVSAATLRTIEEEPLLLIAAKPAEGAAILQPNIKYCTSVTDAPGSRVYQKDTTQKQVETSKPQNAQTIKDENATNRPAYKSATSTVPKLRLHLIEDLENNLLTKSAICGEYPPRRCCNPRCCKSCVSLRDRLMHLPPCAITPLPQAPPAICSAATTKAQPPQEVDLSTSKVSEPPMIKEKAKPFEIIKIKDQYVQTDPINHLRFRYTIDSISITTQTFNAVESFYQGGFGPSVSRNIVPPRSRATRQEDLSSSTPLSKIPAPSSGATFKDGKLAVVSTSGTTPHVTPSQVTFSNFINTVEAAPTSKDELKLTLTRDQFPLQSSTSKKMVGGKETLETETNTDTVPSERMSIDSSTNTNSTIDVEMSRSIATTHQSTRGASVSTGTDAISEETLLAVENIENSEGRKLKKSLSDTHRPTYGKHNHAMVKKASKPKKSRIPKLIDRGTKVLSNVAVAKRKSKHKRKKKDDHQRRKKDDRNKSKDKRSKERKKHRDKRDKNDFDKGTEDDNDSIQDSDAGESKPELHVNTRGDVDIRVIPRKSTSTSDSSDNSTLSNRPDANETSSLSPSSSDDSSAKSSSEESQNTIDTDEERDSKESQETIVMQVAPKDNNRSERKGRTTEKSKIPVSRSNSKPQAKLSLKSDLDSQQSGSFEDISRSKSYGQSNASKDMSRNTSRLSELENSEMEDAGLRPVISWANPTSLSTVKTFSPSNSVAGSESVGSSKVSTYNSMSSSPSSRSSKSSKYTFHTLPSNSIKTMETIPEERSSTTDIRIRSESDFYRPTYSSNRSENTGNSDYTDYSEINPLMINCGSRTDLGRNSNERHSGTWQSARPQSTSPNRSSPIARDAERQGPIRVPCYGPSIFEHSSEDVCEQIQNTQPDGESRTSGGTRFNNKYETFHVGAENRTFHTQDTEEEKNVESKILQTLPMLDNTGSQADHTPKEKQLYEINPRWCFVHKLTMPSSVRGSLGEESARVPEVSCPLNICIKNRGVQTPAKRSVHSNKLVKETVIPVIAQKNIYQPSNLRTYGRSIEVYQTGIAKEMDGKDGKRRSRKSKGEEFEQDDSRHVTSLSSMEDVADVDEAPETKTKVGAVEAYGRRRYSDESLSSWKSSRSNRSTRSKASRRTRRGRRRNRDRRYRNNDYYDRNVRPRFRRRRDRYDDDVDDDDDSLLDYDDRRNRSKYKSRGRFDNRSGSRRRYPDRDDGYPYRYNYNDYDYDYDDDRASCAPDKQKRNSSRNRMGWCAARRRHGRDSRYRRGYRRTRQRGCLNPDDVDEDEDYRYSKKENVAFHDEEVECHNDVGIVGQVFGEECMLDGVKCGCEVCNWDYMRRPEVLAVFVFSLLMVINVILVCATG